MQPVPRLSLIWRAGLAVLLVLALWNPEVPWRRPGVDFVVVVDDSLSMGEGLSTEEWLEIGEAAKGLPSDSHFSLVRFGTNSRIEVPPRPVSDGRIAAHLNAGSPPRRLAVDRASTDIGGALQTASRLADAERNTIMLLVSDGMDLAGRTEEVLRSARAHGVRTYWFEPSSKWPERDSWIEAVQVPDQVRNGQRVPVNITVNGTASTDARLVVRLDGAIAGEKDLVIEGGQPTLSHLWVTPKTSGVGLLEVALTAPGDPNERNNRHARVLNVLGRAPILHVSRERRQPPVSRSLESSGWSIEQVQPSQFPADLRDLGRFAAIVLDDIAVSDLSGDAWTQLERSVRHGGTGLVVLGGPRSFGLGSYYKSRLESLLPVTAEAAESKDSVAVLFLVDKSGSMGREEHGARRFDYARKAVMETAKSLDENDQVGLLWFDAQPSPAMTLATHPDLLREIDRAWAARPGGGTVLAPALRRAIDDLSAVSEDHRLLLLVTDGFLAGSEDLESLRRELAEKEIDLVSILIGGNEQAGQLQRLSEAGNGRFLRVEQVAELPRLMRPALEAWRNPLRLASVTPRQLLSLPFLPDPEPWPTLDGYAVTKARPTADIFLASDRGEPLLAMHHVGAARVLALPGGLGVWADSWVQWPGWGAFVDGLLQWASARSADPNLHLRIEDRPGRLVFTVDAVDPGADWTTGPDGTLTVLGPGGQTWESNLGQIAPGRFEGSAPIGPTGVYAAALRIGNRSLSRSILHTADHELLSARRLESGLEDLEREGLIAPWTPGIDFLDGMERRGMATRFVLLGLASVLYILLLAHERVRWRFGRGGGRFSP